ncbi:MAG TPA: DUF2971 domain-containing protein [Chthoniobacterales bacterium]|nr:DUF2971 domain-containing protein [Chthoniobacterales bacterium]
MSNVFKYCDARGVDILRNLELKITPPNQLNDVFEFSPHVICSAPRRMAKDALRDKATVRESYHEDKRSGFFVGTEREYRRFWKSRRKTLLTPLAGGIVEKLPAVQASFARLQSRYGGVLCLTSNPDSAVMWSHYADQHRGIVVEFDSSWPLFAAGKGLRPVDYVRERPRWDEAAAEGSEAEKAQFDAVIFHKNKEWSYESESRQLFLLHGLKRSPLDNGREGYFLSIRAEIIISVRLGMRCDPETVAKTRDALKTPSLSHVALKKAMPNDKEFSMTTVDLKV